MEEASGGREAADCATLAPASLRRLEKRIVEMKIDHERQVI